LKVFRTQEFRYTAIYAYHISGYVKEKPTLYDTLQCFYAFCETFTPLVAKLTKENHCNIMAYTCIGFHLSISLLKKQSGKILLWLHMLSYKFFFFFFSFKKGKFTY